MVWWHVKIGKHFLICLYMARRNVYLVYLVAIALIFYRAKGKLDDWTTSNISQSYGTTRMLCSVLDNSVVNIASSLQLQSVVDHYEDIQMKFGRGSTFYQQLSAMDLDLKKTICSRKEEGEEAAKKRVRHKQVQNIYSSCSMS